MSGGREQQPSGLKVNLLKKFVKLSSPYNFMVDQAGEGKARIAGRGGIGEGERPYLEKWEWEWAGDDGALEPLKEERREDVRSKVGGGNMVDGVLATEVAGVGGYAIEL